MPSAGPALAEPAAAGAAPTARPAPGARIMVSARPALITALVAFGLVITGFAVAGPTVAVPGAGICVLALTALAWVRYLGGRLALAARIPSTTVIDGEPLRIEIAVRGPRLLGLAGAELHHGLLAEPVVLDRTGRFSLTARARGRGYLRVAPPWVSLADPFGLAQVRVGAQDTVGRLLVLPRTEPVHWLDGDEEVAYDRASPLARGGPTTIDIVGLRDYQPGTPATRIHWPALARGGDLLERVFANENRPAPLVVLDPRAAGPGGEPALLDVLIRAVASLTLALARRGEVDLLLPGQATALRVTAGLGAWPTALRALALAPVAPRGAPPPRIPAAGEGVLYYAACDRGLTLAAQSRWPGRMLCLLPEDPSPGPRGPAVGAAVLEVAGCVARHRGSAP